MEDMVKEFLRREDASRHLVTESKGDLIGCLCQSIFFVEVDSLQNHIKHFMQLEEAKRLFKSILQLLDNTGKVPIKSEGESENDYNRRMDECYETISNNCSDVMPYSDFLHVYIFVISTLIGRPIYVLHEDESGELSWSYFPILFSHTYEAIRQSTDYTALPYITMFFSTDYCYKIDSTRCRDNWPVSNGCIGLYIKLSKRVLLKEDIQKRCVRQMATQLKRPEVQLSVQGAVSSNLIHKCWSKYEERNKEIIYSRNLESNSRRSLNSHRPDKTHFINELLNNIEMVTCFYQVLVLHEKDPFVFECFNIDYGFLPLEFHDKLVRLENAILDLKSSTSQFVTKCTTTIDELTDRRDTVNKSVIAGSAVGIVGGGLAIAGLILTPFTFGASLGLTIAGASLGAGGGIVGGTARAVEGIKQNTSISEIKEIQNIVTTEENNLVDLLHDVSTMISSNLDRHLEHEIEGPGLNKRGFLAIGSAFRSLHGGVAIGLAAARVGAVGASIAASVLGPVSLALDIGFLAEAAHNLRKGSKTGAGEILELNAKAVEMKMVFFMCMLRGNIPETTRITR